MSDVEEKTSGTGVHRPNPAHSGDPRNLGFNATSSAGSIIEVGQDSEAADRGVEHAPCVKTNSDLCPERTEASTSAKNPGLRYDPADHLPIRSQEAHGMGALSPQSSFSSRAIAHSEMLIAECKGVETTQRSVGTGNQVVDPRSEQTMAGEELGATPVREHDSVSNVGRIVYSTSPKGAASAVLGNSITMELQDRENQGAGVEAPNASTLDQQRLLVPTSRVEPRSDNGGAYSVFHNDWPLVASTTTDTTKQTGSEFDSIPRSSPIPNSSQPEAEMRPSTPPSSHEAPALASPVELHAEANLHSTPPSSPMKLSSPPPLKPLKKAARLRTGLAAPFRSPFRRPIPCALPSSSLPPSSPPPLPESSPERPPAKKRRAESPSEEQSAPSKVRRTGPSPFPTAAFVSPLRNSQGEGAKLRARPPAGGFSTPLRQSKIQYETFSSPAVPRDPDVFTTPATTSAYRLSAPPSSDPVLEADATSVPPSGATLSAYKLRPPRVAAARPFKPPAKSSRPTSATVQALKQRLQSLRNALRIRGIADPTRPESTQHTKGMDDLELEALALRWRSAARDAAQDLWGLVKDSTSEDSWTKSGKEKDDGWGWDTKPQRAYQTGANLTEQNSGDVETDATFTPPDGNKVYQKMVKKLSQPFVPRKTMLPPHEDAYEFMESKEGEMECSEREEEEPKAHTLGTMLTSLGIPHEVLGWQEEEGEFTD